jgi:hypothetical protein
MGQKYLKLDEATSRLVQAVSEFRLWAAVYPTEDRAAEWEAEYPEWSSLTTTFCNFLDASIPSDWDEQQEELLLYALARDNEMEVLKDELISRPIHLIALARGASLSSEPDARWQIADALGSVEANDSEVAPLLEPLLRDADEYVSRRALIALTRRGSSDLAFWATRAWDTGDEYQRMAALDALAACNSPLLPSYLDQADTDGR